MRRPATLSLTLALLLAPASGFAEVSVDRGPSGGVTPFYQPGPLGPWDRVRAVPAHDVLNALGDTKADGVPHVTRNLGSGLPEVTWSSGGTDSEIFFVTFTEENGWAPIRNLSHDSSTDEMPNLTSDAAGNRFVVWARSQGQVRSIHFTALSCGTTSCQVRARELSRRLTDVRRPTVAVAADGVAYAAYEEHLEGADQITHVAVDRIAVPRVQGGALSCGGEDPIDLARQVTIRSHRTAPRAAVDARIRAEGDEVWVTWIDRSGSVGFTQLVNGTFAAPDYRSYTDPGGDEAVRESIRLEVLAD